ncbi:MAG: hypothetical protein SO081_03500 [Oscillospiraceae bacterium]|nr:hypothetical protein [Oscillospiraceae bacterium]
MDVVEFFSEFRRMCKSASDCTKCEYHGDKCDNAIELFEKTIAEVEQWSREHPRKTRQDVFMAHYPDAALNAGVLRICPRKIYKSAKINCNITTCYLCKRAFWLQEAE